jgi:hypothetical protein
MRKANEIWCKIRKMPTIEQSSEGKETSSEGTQTN